MAIRSATAVLLFLISSSLGTAAAQPTAKIPMIGYLNPGSSAEPIRQRRLEAFREGLRALGYVEGQDVAIESRHRGVPRTPHTLQQDLETAFGKAAG